MKRAVIVSTNKLTNVIRLAEPQQMINTDRFTKRSCRISLSIVGAKGLTDIEW